MVRSIIIFLFLAYLSFAQTTNRIVYEGWLDSLATISPFSDSILSLITPADSNFTEDLRTPVSSIRLPGSGAPAATAYLGGEVLEFPTNADAKVYFEIQMPHAREEDSNLNIHLHYLVSANGSANDSVRWVFTYTWANISGQYSAPTTVNYTHDVSSDVDSTHYLESVITISGTGKTLSSMLICSLMRDVSEDNYSGSIYLLEIDGHYSARDIFTSTGGVQSGASAFDTTYVYQAINAIGDSNFVLTSETTNWDKTTTDDVEWTDTSATIATQSDLILGYQPLDADLTDLSDGSLTFSKVAGLQDSMNVANAYVDSNYVLKSELLDLVYPVGAVYISVSATSPATLFGGTWVELDSGRVLVSQKVSDADFDVLEETGGNKTVQSSAQTFTGTASTTIVNHTHTITHVRGANTGSDNTTVSGLTSGTDASSTLVTLTTGNPSSGGAANYTPVGTNAPGAATSVVQPYIVVKMWKRTA